MHSISHKELFEDLQGYLEEKKQGLKMAVVHLLFQREAKAPSLIAPLKSSEALADTLSLISNKQKNLTPENVEEINIHELISVLQATLWNIVEILETMSKELFLRLSEVGVDRFEQETYESALLAVETIEENIHELLKFSQEIVPILKKMLLVKNKYEKIGFILKLKVIWGSPLDKKIEKKLAATLHFLRKNFSDFSKAFLYFSSKSEESNPKEKRSDISSERVEALLAASSESQEKFKRLYRLLKLYENVPNKKPFLKKSVGDSIKIAFSDKEPEKLMESARAAIEVELYRLARKCKREIDQSDQAHIVSLRAELHMLGATAERWKNFVKDNDPNPYFRLPWGLGEWRSQGEEDQYPRIIQLLYRIDLMDRKLLALFHSIEEKAHYNSVECQEKVALADKNLHDMGQPLLSQSAFSKKNGLFLQAIQGMHELTAPDLQLSSQITDLFLRALMIDGSFRLLVQHPLFGELFETHMGIVGRSDNPSHLLRIQSLKEIERKAEKWEEREGYRDLEEIQHQIHDLQQLYQEFYHSLSKPLQKEEELASFKLRLEELKNELLEERVTASLFMAKLDKAGTKVKGIKDNLRFLDNYFEAIQIRLNEELSSLSLKIPEG